MTFLLFPSNVSVVLNSCPAAAAKSLQSCPTLCDPIDGSPSGSSVPGILQARILEWVAISFSNVWKWKVKVKSLSHVRLLATPWTAAYQAPPSMGFSRQEYWSRVPLPSPNPCQVGLQMWLEQSLKSHFKIYLRLFCLFLAYMWNNVWEIKSWKYLRKGNYYIWQLEVKSNN